MALDPNDGGYSSRKMWMSIGTSFLMSLCWLATGKWPILGPTYDTLLGGLLTALGLFISGNVVSKHLISKAQANVSFAGEITSAATTTTSGPSKPPTTTTTIQKLVVKKDEPAAEPAKDDGVTEEGG